MEKDIDVDAEEFIVGWTQEFPPQARVKLRIELEQWPTEDPNEMVRQALRNYFSHRAQISNLGFRRLLKRGRASLIIGLLFLAACLATIKTFLPNEVGTWASVLRESLTIAGWVAMWRPMQICLYDWWPLRRRTQLYEKLSHIPVEVVQHSKG